MRGQGTRNAASEERGSHRLSGQHLAQRCGKRFDLFVILTSLTPKAVRRVCLLLLLLLLFF